jgi:hypothetical protein
MEHVIGGKFKLGKKIGSGSFGELYLGTRLAGSFRLEIFHALLPFSTPRRFSFRPPF